MVRRYAHLSSKHLATYVDRVSGPSNDADTRSVLRWFPAYELNPNWVSHRVLLAFALGQYPVGGHAIAHQVGLDRIGAPFGKLQVIYT